MWTDTFQVKDNGEFFDSLVSEFLVDSLPPDLPGLHLSGQDEGGHVDRYLLGKDTAESGLPGVRVTGGYNLPGDLLGVHLLHLSGRDEGSHVDRHLSGKDTAES